ncbi:MAG: LysR family transcriptional regulator [Deltaproteobacteria bacterium]|nr:LysR family transcriptional regulator [Deltaproteobacteria bacterium]
MTFKQLVIFAAAAKSLNLTKTAQALGISQPSISKHLRLLETYYKIKLFTRDSAGIQLTEAGRIFLRHVTAILTRLEKLNRRFPAVRSGGRPGSLTVGGSYGPSAILLPSVLAVFKKRYPQTQVSLRTYSRTFIERLVLDSEVDIAVISKRSRSPYLVSEPYRLDKLLAFVSPAHALAKKGVVSLAEIKRTPLIVAGGKRGPSAVDEVLKQLATRGYRLNISMRFESPDAVKTAVKAKMGIGVLYEDNVRRDIRRGDFKAIRFPELAKFAIESYIIYRKGRPLSANAQAFLRLLREWQREQ